MKTLCALALIAAVALFTTACGSAQPAAASKDTAQPAQEITVVGVDMAFQPTTVEVKAGQPVKVTLKNQGVMEQNWQDKLANETVTVQARPGQSASKTFTPREAGTYEVICSIPGHEQAGMVGTLVVTQ